MPKQVIVELDDATAAELDGIAPSRARKRSEFIRQALRKALDEAAEKKMAAAYRMHPDDTEVGFFDPAVWEPRRSPQGKKRR